MLCGVMLGVASILGSFATTTLQLASAYILLPGSSLGTSCVLSKEAVGYHFDERHSTAVGIARTGTSIALFLCGLLVQLFLDTYGWRGTMLLMGGIFSHMTVCGALMHTSGGCKLRTNDYQQLQSTGDSPSARFDLRKKRQLQRSIRFSWMHTSVCTDFPSVCSK